MSFGGWSRSRKAVEAMDWKISAHDYLKSKIDEYKYGVISASEFCRDMEDIEMYPRAVMDKKTERVVKCMIPETCKAYMDAEESDADRDLKFWIGLKDCAYYLDRGYTFTEEREKFFKTGKGRLEPVEYTDQFLAIEPEMERLVRAETGEGGWTGFCHTYWTVKKKVLKEHFGIDWKSTDDRFPGLLID